MCSRGKRLTGRQKVARLKWACLSLALLCALVLAFACVGLVLLIRDAQAQGPAADHRPADVVLVLDHSSSMWEMGGVGSDPDLLRVEAANLFISYLGLDAGSDAHRLAVIHFGGTAELVVPLTLLDSPDRRAAVRQAIADPAPMGWTDPLAALQLAYDELLAGPRADPSHRRAIVLLSDGKPEGPAFQTPAQKAAYLAELRALARQMAAQDCPVFTVALSSAATDADPDIQTVYRSLWQEIAALTPPAGYHEARIARDLLSIYHDIVARIAGAQSGSPAIETLVDGAMTYPIAVPDGLSRLTLVVLKEDPAIGVRVLRPGGILLGAGDSDVRYSGGADENQSRQEVWAVAFPRPGEWTVELDGRGYVIVWQDEIALPASAPAPAYTIEVHEPAAYIPDNVPVQVSVSLRDGAGTLRVDPDLQVTVELRRAGYTEATLLAQPGPEGLFTARWTGPLPGVYTLHLRVLQGGRPAAQWEGAFEVVALPRLELVSMNPRADGPIESGEQMAVEVRAVAGGLALQVQEQRTLDALRVTLAGADGEQRPLSPRQHASGWQVALQAPSTPGEYALLFYLSGRAAHGLPVDDTLSVPFQIVPAPAPDIPTLAVQEAIAPSPVRRPPAWGWIAGLGGLLAIGGVGGGWWLSRRGPRLPGQLRVLGALAGQAADRVLDLSLYRRQAEIDREALAPGDSGEWTAPPLALRAVRDEEGQIQVEIRPPAHGAAEAVLVNGGPLSLPHALWDGDVIVAGDWRLRYENLGQAARRRRGAASQRLPREMAAVRREPPAGSGERRTR